jgi:hypothetical protein
MATRYKWLSGDVNWLDYGGKWYKKDESGDYTVRELINMRDCCGSDAEYTYAVRMFSINLDDISDGLKDESMSICGCDESWDDLTDDRKLEMLVSSHGHGLYEEYEGNNYKKLFAMV